MMTKSSSPVPSLNFDKKKKKSIIPSIFGKKVKPDSSSEELFQTKEIIIDFDRGLQARRFLEAGPLVDKSFSDRHQSSRIKGLNLSTVDRPSRSSLEIQELRVFVATWNVAGKQPHNGLNLKDFLQVEGSSDIYVLGFQEIVPLNAGNVLVLEDNEPAAKWLSLICQALNKPHENDHSNRDDSSESSSSKHNNRHVDNSKEAKSSSNGLIFFQKPSLKILSKGYHVDGVGLRACNCHLSEESSLRHKARELRDFMRSESDTEDDLFISSLYMANHSQMAYSLISTKKMVGIFLSVWIRTEIVPHIGHLRVSSIGRGIMGCLGNKGCIALSMSLHQTSFCFVCSHLASGEREGDELRRNLDVAEILKNTHFPKSCRKPGCRIPETILEHDRVIWLGDLNYRVALSYDETRSLLKDNDWDTLLQKDQLRIEKDAGRVFKGWKEGKIFFPPTYKYSRNSDLYAGEIVKSKWKRRTPAWCDRILWYGKGMELLQYIRGESRFSDHRPVCAVFVAEVEMNKSNIRGRRFYSSTGARLPFIGSLSQRHN